MRACISFVITHHVEPLTAYTTIVRRLIDKLRAHNCKQSSECLGCECANTLQSMVGELTVLLMERDAHAKLSRERGEQVVKAKAQMESLQWAIRGLDAYTRHTDRCVLSFWEGGEPTPDGGYRQRFKGVWYQVKPVDETPKCDCGLAGMFAALEALDPVL